MKNTCKYKQSQKLSILSNHHFFKLKTYLLTILLIFPYFLNFSFAQNNKIKEIKKYYDNINKEIQNLRQENIPCSYELNLHNTIPGSGQQSLFITYYFFEKDKQDAIRNKKELVKITICYNIAARRLYREFVFKDDKLVFYFFKPDINSPQNEVRNYYEDNQLILYAIAPDQFNENNNKDKLMRSANFNGNEKGELKSIFDTSIEYLNIFKTLLKIQETNY